VEELRREALAQAIVWLPTFAVALGTLGVNIMGIVAGLGLTGDLRYTELDAEKERVLVPNSKMLTDPIRVSKPATGGAI